MPFLPYQSRNPVVTTTAWLPFLLGMPPFSLVSSLCYLKYTPGFLLQLFPNILLYPTLCLIVPCCFLFIVALPCFMFSLIREALCCWYLFTSPWSGQVIWWSLARLVFLTCPLMNPVFPECILVKESSVSAENQAEHWAQTKVRDLLPFISLVPNSHLCFPLFGGHIFNISVSYWKE